MNNWIKIKMVDFIYVVAYEHKIHSPYNSSKT